MFAFAGAPGTEARSRFTTWIFYVIVVFLLVAALATPLVAAFGPWLPAGESRAIWIQRSGAVTTLFSFMAGAMAVFTSGQLYTPGFFGDAVKLHVLKDFRLRFRIAEAAVFLLSLAGTVIWGYGDLIYSARHG